MLARPALEFRRQRRVARRHAVVRGALEDGQVGCRFRDHRRGLDAGGTGADLADALAAEVHALVRPLAGVVPAALECIQARDRRYVCRGQATDGSDQPGRGAPLAGFGLDAPVLRRLVELRGHDPVIEADVAPQVELARDVIQIGADFGRPGIALGGFPLLGQLAREEIAVGVAFRIAARARVAVPVPGAAQVAAGLQHLRLQAQAVAQAQQLVEPGEACANDDRVQMRAANHGC